MIPVTLKVRGHFGGIAKKMFSYAVEFAAYILILGIGVLAFQYKLRHASPEDVSRRRWLTVAIGLAIFLAFFAFLSVFVRARKSPPRRFASSATFITIPEFARRLVCGN